jgi:uncharacterized protein YndB with AHSA1/START domain
VRIVPFGIGGTRRTVSSASRSRVLSAPVADVWKVVEDPYQMPRWWPGVERIEGVEAERFTQVFRTKKRRRTVRADFRLLASEAPDAEHPSGHRTWEQEVAGTPFERVLQEAITEVLVEPAEGGTRVTIAQRQRLRGYSRLGALSLRGATLKRLDEALEGLERILG